MRIGDKKTPQVTETVVKEIGIGRGVRPNSNIKPSQTDKVEISNSARELARARRLMNVMPDIRADKVDSLKSVIKSGAYKVDTEKVAVKIIERALRDSLYVKDKR